MLNKFFDYNLDKNFFKKIFIPLSLKLKLFTFNNYQILGLFNNEKFYYFLLPLNLKFFFFANYIIFTISYSKFLNFKTIYLFFFKFLKILKLLIRISSQTILIRGIGLKITFLENLNSLNLKLGFSHMIELPLLKNIMVHSFKKKIILSSLNKVILGNFSSLIFRYKPLNIFTGKGLFIKNKKKIKLKFYKKKI